MQTGDNSLFVRQWFEVCNDKIHFHSTDYISAMYTGKKWFPYNKGGVYRKWYGNNDYIVNWENDGRQISNFVDDKGKLRSRPQNKTYYFRKSITWSKISSGGISFRFKDDGFIFDVAGTSLFNDDIDLLFYILALNNTNTIQHILRATSPTLNYEVGQIAKIPIIIDKCREVKVVDIVKENILQSRKDWDSFEISWNFKKHPLL